MASFRSQRQVHPHPMEFVDTCPKKPVRHSPPFRKYTSFGHWQSPAMNNKDVYNKPDAMNRCIDTGVFAYQLLHLHTFTATSAGFSLKADKQLLSRSGYDSPASVRWPNPSRERLYLTGASTSGEAFEKCVC